MEKEEILHCACHSLDHIALIQYDKEDLNCYLSVHLTKLPFFKRLWHGIKYIFGFASSYGDFDEFIWDIETVDRLLSILNQFKTDCIKNEVEEEMKNVEDDN